MKAVAAPLAALDGNALSLDADAAEGDDAAPGAGFDALLALANAQATKGPTPVKALAPSVGVQPAPSEMSEGAEKGAALLGKTVKGPLSANHVDVGPTRAFLPWLTPGLSDAALSQADVSAAEASAVDESGLLKTEEPALDAKAKLSATPTLPAVPTAASDVTSLEDAVHELSPDADEAPRGAAPRKARERDALKDARDASPPAAVIDPSVSPQLVPAVVQLKQSVPAAVQTKAASVDAPSAPAAQSVAAPAARMPVADLSASAVAADGAAPGFGDLLTAQSEPAPNSAAVAIPMSNEDTGAVVTKIEFYETPASTELTAPDAAGLPAELKQVADGEAARPDAASASPESQDEGGARSEREPEPQPAPAPRFEVTEGKGMRGLDAVVASLLRPYQEKPEGKSGVRVATASAPHISVETGKSQNVKLEERGVNVAQALDAAALRREDEQRRGEVRELLDAATPHVAQHIEMPADAPKPFELAPAQAAATVNVPVPLPDPDAALMGKLVRGESLNAAVSIEHPELGSMEVLVQSENGRIDVRATLDTPRAAAVLRAHESALRYGVQQAGLTFGALRVNARTGEAKIERSRDVTKRRRERDWEA